MWNAHQDGKKTAQSPGDLTKFMRDAERRAESKKSKGFGARLKQFFKE
jgi:hypothetical protein